MNFCGGTVNSQDSTEDKPIVIPERPQEKNSMHVPEFIRNVMGSSAGAGSGEFHVYRHLRRKEYARLKDIQQKSEQELLDEAYKKKLEENARLAEEKTAKRRARRQRKKEKMRLMRKKLRKEEHKRRRREARLRADDSGNDSGDRDELDREGNDGPNAAVNNP